DPSRPRPIVVVHPIHDQYRELLLRPARLHYSQREEHEQRHKSTSHARYWKGPQENLPASSFRLHPSSFILSPKKSPAGAELFRGGGGTGLRAGQALMGTMDRMNSVSRQAFQRDRVLVRRPVVFDRVPAGEIAGGKNLGLLDRIDAVGLGFQVRLG